MVKKYFIFDRFGFLCRFFRIFFITNFFGRTKFTRSSLDKLILILLINISGLQALIRGFGLVGYGVSIPDTHAVNTVCPLRPKFPYQNIPILLPLIRRRYLLASSFAFGFGLPPFGATCEKFGIVVHVRGCEIPTCKVGDPIMDFVLTCRDEAALLAVKGVVNL